MPTLQDTYALYVPFCANARAEWRVLEGSHVLGIFGSREESLKFALRLVDLIAQRGMQEVRLLVEEATGEWIRCVPDKGGSLPMAAIGAS